MIKPHSRKRGQPHSKVKKCPNCGAALVSADVYHKGGSFCRKCGDFIDLKRDKEDFGGYQFKNME